jgi:hypothetical protein
MADTSAATAPQIQGGNKFTFTSEDGSTQVIFFPTAPGPIVQGQPVGPRLEYTGEEGNFVFLGDQVRIQESPLGVLLTVTLKLNVDTGGITFTIVLPVVRGAAQGQPQPFETIGIKTTTVGFVIKPGAQSSYYAITLDSVAEIIELPA